MSTAVADESRHTHSLTAKAAAAIFVTVVAPVLVAVGVKLVDAVTTSKAPEAAGAVMCIVPVPPAAVVAAPTPASVATTDDLPLAPAAPAIATPLDWTSVPHAGPRIRLFNGRDLAGFYSYLGPAQEGEGPVGRSHDRNRVFSVRDGALFITGQTPGALITRREFNNYHLKLRYRWAERTWPPHAESARSSGVLLHCHGHDGAVRRSYPLSIRCDLVEGSSGDLVPYGGPQNLVDISVEARRHEFVNAAKYKQLFCYEPGQPLTTLATGLIKRKPADLAWKDTLGYTSPIDVERPHGQWNDLECICLGNRVIVRLNGQTVNDVTSNLTSGKIAFQSHYAAIALRDVTLQPLAAP
jgi:Domain of Unknown Function (DUF1080)